VKQQLYNNCLSFRQLKYGESHMTYLARNRVNTGKNWSDEAFNASSHHFIVSLLLLPSFDTQQCNTKLATMTSVAASKAIKATVLVCEHKDEFQWPGPPVLEVDEAGQYTWRQGWCAWSGWLIPPITLPEDQFWPPADWTSRTYWPIWLATRSGSRPSMQPDTQIRNRESAGNQS
jgi:hypothetical protein